MSPFAITALWASLVLQFASAAPTEISMSKRQDQPDFPSCKESGCSDCPLTVGPGNGWPTCVYYDTQQFADAGYPVEDNGQMTVFFDIPDLDAGCRYFVRTPVVQGTDTNCGGNVLIAQGATCAPVRVDNTFILSFCCGTGDCSAAGVPFRSRGLSASGAGSGGSMVFKYANGTVMEPKTNPPPAVEKKLKKRDCDSFTVTNGPYTTGGQVYTISDIVSCGQTESCSATLGTTVTESFGLSASVSVGDPLGIVSATVSVSYEQSIAREFSGTYNFGPGERGYVTFIPILTCVEGYFNGDCDGNGEIVTACGPTRTGGEMSGDQRAVLIRG